MDLGVATNTIQGQEVILQISDDNEANWYTLVCAEKMGSKFNRPVKQRPTQCGTVVGKSPSPTRSIDFSGVFNIVDDALVNNAGFASGKKLKFWADNGTALIIRQIFDDGVNLVNKSSAYISDYSEDVPMDDVVGFSVSFAMFGTWTYAQ